MNPVTNSAQSSPLATTPAAGAALAASKAGGDQGQDRFLKILVTQLKNQDPLNPMDNAQITSQMAQISTVSGIEKLNATLQTMAAAFSTGQSLQATSLIGRQVFVPGDQLRLHEGAADGGVELAQAADKVVVTIRDASGQVLHRADLGAQTEGVITFQWDGVTDSGAAAVNGVYNVLIEATQGGNKVEALGLQRGLVGGVTQDKGGVTLNIAGIGKVTLSDVRQVF